MSFSDLLSARRGYARHARRASLRTLLAALVLAGGLSLGACDETVSVEMDARPDADLTLVEVDLSRSSAEAVDYVAAVGEAHAAADALLPDDPQGALVHLRKAWELACPDQVDAARVTRLELSARMGELMLNDEGGAVDAVALLRPLLAPERPLPKDRSSARALVALGDAATAIEDDALAAGSYARAVRVMSALRKEMAK